MKKLRRIIFGISLTLLCQISIAQSPSFSQYYTNHIFYNPAFTGYHSGNNLNAIYRHELSEFKNWGLNSLGAAYTRSTDSTNSGIGVSLYFQDENAFVSTFGLNFVYSYNLELSEDFDVTLGGSVGAYRKTIEEIVSTVVDPNTGQVYQVTGPEGKIYGVLNFGILLSRDKFDLGVSALNVNRPKVEFNILNQQIVPTIFYLLFAYEIMENELMSLKPTFLIKQQQGDRKTGLNADLMFAFMEKFDLGLGIKTTNLFRAKDQTISGPELYTYDALTLFAGMELLADTDVMISYEYPFRQQNNLTKGVVEGSINFSF